MAIAAKVTEYKKGKPLQIVMVARGIKEKGWEEAIEAVLQLDKKYPGLMNLQLIGEGVFLNELKTKHDEPALAFLGYREDVKPIISNAHLGILPTYYIAESLPNSIIEYLRCGKPAITTNVGAIFEMISCNNEKAGACINLEDGKVNIDCLAAAIEQYIINPGLLEKHSAIALKAAQKFTMEKCVEGYLNVFTDLQKEIKVHE